jgi:multisubunit Na+/H+ antiporter MnhG subunit
MHTRMPALVVVSLPPIVLQVVVLLSSVLMNWNISEVYVSRMILLLAPVSASALSRCSSLLTMRHAAHYQLSGWLLGGMILLAWFC